MWSLTPSVGYGGSTDKDVLVSLYQVGRDLRAEQRYRMGFPETGEILCMTYLDSLIGALAERGLAILLARTE